jgi:hypothetical protein
MATLPPDALLTEVLQKAHNAKTREEKIKILQENESPALKSILIWNYDESVESELPDGEVPYTPNEAPVGTEHTRLAKEYRILYNFVKGGNYDISKTRKETMFIQLIEGLHKDEAELLCLVKDKKLGTKYRITHNVVKDAFPSIQWGNRV